MSEEKSGSLYLLRLVPPLMLVCFVAWCSSSNRVRQDNFPVMTELKDLFQQEGLVDGVGSVDLAEVAKRTGEPGMNKLLYEAASGSSLDAIKWLVKNGADPRNVGTIKDLTLLQKAAKMPRYERIEYFLSFGLDPLQRGRDNVTVLDIAAQGGLDQRTLSLLIDKWLKVTDVDASGKKPIHYASVKSIPALVAAGSDIDAADAEGRTALHYAARDGQNAVVVELLNHGASVYAQDNRGRTPLHLAAMSDNANSVIDVLLAAGAPRTMRDNDGKTARDIATDEQRPSRRNQNSLADKL